MRFKLDIEKLQKNTILSIDKFDYRLQQVQEGGFVKKEAEAYLLGMYLHYTPRSYDCYGNQVGGKFSHATWENV